MIINYKFEYSYKEFVGGYNIKSMDEMMDYLKANPKKKLDSWNLIGGRILAVFTETVEDDDFDED